MSSTLTVNTPAALSVTCAVAVPLESESNPGSDALPLVDVNDTVLVIDVTVFQLGARRVTLWALLYVLLLVVALFYVSAWAERWLRNVLARTSADIGARAAVAAIARYVLVFVGLLVIVQTAGIDLTTLNVLAGAVGLGVGIGLQSIASNFVSGLVLLFERPQDR